MNSTTSEFSLERIYIRGTQRLLAVNYMFGEANIAKNFSFL